MISWFLQYLPSFFNNDTVFCQTIKGPAFCGQSRFWLEYSCELVDQEEVCSVSLLKTLFIYIFFAIFLAISFGFGLYLILKWHSDIDADQFGQWLFGIDNDEKQIEEV